jgi:hypothetical protein
VYWTLFARLRRGRVSSERVPAAQGEHPEAANR